MKMSLKVYLSIYLSSPHSQISDWPGKERAEKKECVPLETKGYLKILKYKFKNLNYMRLFKLLPH